MKYVLDTDTLIYLLKGHENVIEHLSFIPSESICTTIINHSELLFGAYNSARKKTNLEKVQLLLSKIPILPFCQQSSSIFAQHKAKLREKGNTLADLDLMIASITMQHQMILVTNNIKHFSRLINLNLENWTVKRKEM